MMNPPKSWDTRKGLLCKVRPDFQAPLLGQSTYWHTKVNDGWLVVAGWLWLVGCGWLVVVGWLWLVVK
jgi:hypothetical protein